MALNGSIRNWYENQTVFLTGGTGFFGVAYIHKLLKLNVKKIYILIRKKKGTDADQRLEALFQDSAFEELRKTDLCKRVIAIEGDMAKLRMGISESDEKILEQDVTMVLHAAATIRFNEPLKCAVMSNLRATREVVQLAKRMKHLQIFAHISTSYSNLDHQRIEEKIYPAKMDWKKLIKVAEVLSEQELAVIYEKIIQGFPNTYVFTKHLAERLIADAAAEIPAVIIRPPVVFLAYREPKPGWTRGDTGMYSMNMAVGMGVLRVGLVDLSSSLAIVPIDVVVNATLAAAWKSHMDPSNSYQPVPAIVYQIDYKNYDWKSWQKVMYEADNMVPQTGKAWHAIVPYFFTSFYLYYIMNLILHLIPGTIFDTILRFTGRKTRLLKIYRILYNVSDVLRHFTTQTYEFDTNNIKALQNSIPDSDKDTFPFDMPVTESEWLEYCKNCSRGARELAGHPRIPTEQDIKHAKRLYYVHCGFLVLCYVSVIWIFPYKAFCNLIINTVSF